MKTTIKPSRIVNLLIGAAEAEARGLSITPEYAPQVERARVEINMLRGSDVLAAVLVIKRGNGSLGIDVSTPRCKAVTD